LLAKAYQEFNVDGVNCEDIEVEKIDPGEAGGSEGSL